MVKNKVMESSFQIKQWSLYLAIASFSERINRQALHEVGTEPFIFFPLLGLYLLFSGHVPSPNIPMTAIIIICMDQ